ncbi:MAG: DUF5916 domain-containing protein [Pseudomonadales bacterium]|nr:DUF5916 domain-containing protein [Pseudomonadales bacterium]
MAGNALRGLLLIIASSLISLAVAQDQIPQLTRIDVEAANIQLDGFLDEPVWDRIPAFDGMRVINPDTLAETPYQTDIRVFYTERGIYVGVKNHQPEDTLVALMTPRDTQLNRDGFVVGVDASGEGLWGFFLRINLGDSMTDMSILPERQLNLQWDGAWNARTQPLEDGWSVEYYIPWSMMPLPAVESSRRIGFYFERQVGSIGGEAWSNPPLPRTVNEFLSAFMKFGLRDIEPRRQLTYYPFVSTVFDAIRHDNDPRVGADIYWRPTTNTLLSATLNPDFGTVIADDVIINLTAFEQFFPERRVFFQEGQDIFNNTSPRTRGGRGPGGPIQILNTRRIGGAAEFDVPDGVSVVPTDLSQPTDLFGAARIAGQSGNLRYGALIASEDDPEIQGTLEDGTPVGIQAIGRDFFVGRLLYEDTSGGGRRQIGWMGTMLDHPNEDSTVNALDLHYFSADNRFVVDTQFLHSDNHGVTGQGFTGDFNYRPRRGVQHTLSATYFDDTFDMNEMGFLTRNDQANLNYSFNLVESDVPGIRFRSTRIFTSNEWNTDGHPVRMGLFFNRDYQFNNFDNVNFGIQYFPRRIDDRLGRGTGDWVVPDRFGFRAGYQSNVSEPFAWNINLDVSQEDLGPMTTEGRGGITIRPSDRFSLDLQLRYEDREALLVHRGGGNYTSFESHSWSPRLEVNYFITARQRLRFTTQWTGLKAFEDMFYVVNPAVKERLHAVPNPDDTPDDFVISRMTFQARYRWEIAPLSDLFVVYTRGANLPRNSFFSFQDLLEQSWNDRIVEQVAIMLRYRFGS